MICNVLTRDDKFQLFLDSTLISVTRTLTNTIMPILKTYQTNSLIYLPNINA